MRFSDNSHQFEMQEIQKTRGKKNKKNYRNNLGEEYVKSNLGYFWLVICTTN